MRMVIEDCDIKEVKSIASEYYGVMLTDEQAKNLIEEDNTLAAELYDLGGLDTEGRHILSSALVKSVMKDELPPETKKSKWVETKWEWPLNGDSESYKKEFDVKFKEAAKKRGIKLVD